MRVLLDTNVWSRMGDDGSGASWNAIAEANDLEIVLAPSVLVEVLRIPPADARKRVIETMARGPCRRRLQPEAYLESMEFVDATRRHRPEWLRQVPDPAVVAKHMNFWTKGIWREALADPSRLHDQARQGVVREYLTDTQRVQRRDLLKNNVSLSPLSALVVTADPGTPPDVLRGWSGESAPAWRISLRDLYWYQLVVLGGRAVLTREDSTYLDWIGAYVDRSRLRRSAEDFTSLWLNEVTIEEVHRNWLRWAVSVIQLDSKVTGGNPVDEQHSAYLLDCDQFVTADQPYARALNRVREEAPFGMSEVNHISAAGVADTAHRVAEALDL